MSLLGDIRHSLFSHCLCTSTVGQLQSALANANLAFTVPTIHLWNFPATNNLKHRFLSIPPSLQSHLFGAELKNAVRDGRLRAQLFPPSSRFPPFPPPSSCSLFFPSCANGGVSVQVQRRIQLRVRDIPRKKGFTLSTDGCTVNIGLVFRVTRRSNLVRQRCVVGCTRVV